MSKAALIVDALLENDPPDVDSDPDSVSPENYLHQVADQIDKDAREGRLTRQTALTARTFWHRTATYKDGVRHVEARRNGATKTWKRQPERFQIPVKYGMYDYFYITDTDAADWSTVPLPDKPKPVPVKPKRVVSPSSLMPPL